MMSLVWNNMGGQTLLPLPRQGGGLLITIAICSPTQSLQFEFKSSRPAQALDFLNYGSDFL